MSGPTTPARAWPEAMPKVPMDTAIASSKLLPDAVNATLVRREGSPEHVAKAVLHFIDNDFVTGVCLPVDGGRTVYAPDPPAGG